MSSPSYPNHFICFLFFSLYLLHLIPCLAATPPPPQTHSHHSVDYHSFKAGPKTETIPKPLKPFQPPRSSQQHNAFQQNETASPKQIPLQLPLHPANKSHYDNPIPNSNHIANHPPQKKLAKHIHTKSHLVTRIIQLLNHSRNLNRQILDEREQNERANAHFQNSLKRLSDMSDSRANVQKSLRLLNRDLKEYRRQSPLYAQTIDILNRQVGAALLEINRLKTSKYNVIHEKALLQDHFRHRGLEAWVQNYLKDSVNPLVAGAVVEGTADVVEPMLDGIETLAAVNEDLAKRMASKIRQRVPLIEKPFYSGFVTYTVLLFPLVLVTSVLLKIKRSLLRFSTGHFIILCNFYFTLLSGGCFIATLLGSVDVLRTFRHVNLGMFDLVMVLHGILYIIHISLHVMMAFKTKERALLWHTLLLLMIGAHFFIHSYLHAMHNEDPHVDKRAYAIYTGVFAYIFYNWIVKHIRMSVEATKMKLNNKSISTIENQALAGMTVNPSRAVTLVSLSRQNKVSSSMPYACPSNEISQIEATPRSDIRIDNILFSKRTVPRQRDDTSSEKTYGIASNMCATARTKADDPKDL